MFKYGKYKHDGMSVRRLQLLKYLKFSMITSLNNGKNLSFEVGLHKAALGLSFRYYNSNPTTDKIYDA